jgi:hypothetical protein
MIQQHQATAEGQVLTSKFHAAISSKGAPVIAIGSEGLTDHLNGPRAIMIRGDSQGLAPNESHRNSQHKPHRLHNRYHVNNNLF